MNQYLIQIDALRFYAVFSVMIIHLYPETLPTFNFLTVFYSFIPGVPLFFCISGFLITGILIKTQNGSRWNLLKIFYIRRFLRIFPIYYLTLFVLFVVNLNDYRSWFLYDLFYLSNIVQGLNGEFGGTIAPHFWSLAVEEQFYIFWPAVLLFIRQKWYQVILCVLIFLVGTILMLFGENRFLISKTVGCLSYLGSGAILAVFWQHYRNQLYPVIKYLWIALVALAILVVAESYLDIIIPSKIHLLISIFMIPIITVQFASGFQNKILRMIFENNLIIYLGKISYGLYIFHLLMLYPAVLIKKTFGLEFLEDPFAMFIFKMLLAILVSALSWELFEKRINRYKDNFAYNKQIKS